ERQPEEQRGSPPRLIPCLRPSHAHRSSGVGSNHPRSKNGRLISRRRFHQARRLLEALLRLCPIMFAGIILGNRPYEKPPQIYHRLATSLFSAHGVYNRSSQGVPSYASFDCWLTGCRHAYRPGGSPQQREEKPATRSHWPDCASESPSNPTIASCSTR